MPTLRPDTAISPSSSDSESEPLDRYVSLVETPPVKPQSMDRNNSPIKLEGGRMNIDLIGRGLHMPAEVLGEVESPAANAVEQQQQTLQQEAKLEKKKKMLAEVNVRARRRSQAAVRATLSRAASAAAAAQHSRNESGGTGGTTETSSSLMTLVTYGGVEVIFSTTTSFLVGVCSRTHYIFQKLHLVSEAPVTSLTSNSTSGMLVVAHQDGIIQTYHPERTDPNKISFGKFIWTDGLTIDAAKLFYQSDEEQAPSFLDRTKFHDNTQPGNLIDISSSSDHKLLVAHKTQLAVFEAIARRKDPTSPRSTGGRLLWTTMLPANIVTAKISGDGQAIVVVLEGDRDEEGSYGSRTFIHDLEDGSLSQPALERTISVGMVYKPGPFLKHSAPVTRISFRGLGRATSARLDRLGNDLLLTYCKSDSTVRIFNQNGWKQLMLWAAPPNSRADWIRGSAAFSLGDLESGKKKKTSSKAASRRPSEEALVPFGGASPGLRNTTGNPTTAAGAWIAEITFRGAFPALRLSRLSYMKRGTEDSQPAYFESVAAILPAGSLVAESVLNSDDMGLAIQGVWPAWNPWLSEPPANPHDQTLTGSAMEFLGLSSIPPLHSQFFGESYLGGTHSPPTELRIVAAHPAKGNVVVMEFPLWGDDDFGAMELGSPLRSVLSLSSAFQDIPPRNSVDNLSLQCTSIDYDSSRLSAQIDPGQRSISLLWRKQGSQSLYSSHYLEEDSIFCRSMSKIAQPQTPQWMEDKSVIACPVALPSIHLPNGKSSVNGEIIVCIKWWPDVSFDGPPLLLALTRTATLLVFEIPPPRSAREPAMPNFDPFNESGNTSVEDLDHNDHDDDSVSEASEDTVRSEYEVGVTPHPDFGLGLRLESPVDGLRTIAGSFKRHPLSGGMLPAEKTGMIMLGDQVLSVNGVSLENMTFDDIISTIRHVSTEAGPGKPLTLRFRPGESDSLLRNSAVLQASFKPVESRVSDHADSAIHRKQATGLKPVATKRSRVRKHSDGGSLTSMLVGSHGQPQQEFGRVVAVLRKAIPPTGEEPFPDKRLVVTPLGKGVGAPSPDTERGALLLLVAIGNKILVKRMVLPVGFEPSQAELVELGSVGMGEGRQIQSLYPVDVRDSERCYAVNLESGDMILLVLELKEIKSPDSPSPTLSVSFRQHRLFTLDKDFEVRAAAIDLVVTYGRELGSHRSTIRVFTSRNDVMCRRQKSQSAIEDEFFGQDYVQEEIEIAETGLECQELCDVKLFQSGHLDNFPTLVVFLTSEAHVYQRRATGSKWVAIARVSYTMLPSSSPLDDERLVATKDPCDVFPHILPLICSVVPSFDESSYLLSDWHPESLLAYLCTDDRGAKVAVEEHVQKIVELLAELVDSSSSNQNILSSRSPLLVAPFESVGGTSLLKPSIGVEPDTRKTSESARAVFGRSTQPNETDESKKLTKLLKILEYPRTYQTPVPSSGKSREFQLAMSLNMQARSEESNDVLPPLLEAFPEAELRVLWAITDLVKNPPLYDKIDSEGQFSLAIFALHKSLKKSPMEGKTKGPPTSAYGKSILPSFYQRNRSSSSLQEKARLSPQCASAAAVSALLSKYQGHLVESFRQPATKLDWDTVRESRVAFWLRSDEKLRQISEQVGQSMYRESRDILKAAVFFLAAGKLRTLRNLAAADNSESGQKFSKFLSSFDFSTDRGRSAAEKNAFSLLRKNKYECAAAFFLLAQPPLLQSAVETIASKMEDLDLAFMVSRLISNAQAMGGGNNEFGFREAGMGFGGILGGGGGYAGMSSFAPTELETDKESFHEWNPTLSKATEALLESRMLPNVLEDSPFCALLLLWLGRKEEAWHWLSGFVRRRHGVFAEFVRDGSLVRLHETTPFALKSQDPTIEMTNAFINFVAGPVLLKQMNAASRTRAASAMMVASSLCRIGIELPAMRALSHAGNGDNEEDEVSRRKTSVARVINSVQSDFQHAPSMFNSFDPSPQARQQAAPSIFESFDRPLQTTTRATPSIFDSFDPPRQAEQRTAPASIFDQFDGPPRQIAPKSTPVEATSSIFDSFDVPSAPSTRTKAVCDGMESSIFDSFDAPSAKPSVQVPQAYKTSSIFDSFDVPRPGEKEINTSISKQASATSPLLEPNSKEADEDGDEPLEPLRRSPPLWKEWHRRLLIKCAARRLIRETATIGCRFNLDEFHPTILPRGQWSNPIIPTSAAQVLQLHVSGDELITEVHSCLNMLSETSGLETNAIGQEALRILESPYQYPRMCFSVVLHLAMNHEEEAEDIVRSTAHGLIEQCRSLSFSNDHLVFSRQTISHLGSLPQRQTAASLSWQLEVCLWLHRGGGLPMSGLALNESICAVRIGMLVASWNRDFEAQETMLRQPADCLVDTLTGRQLCTSLKMISNHVVMEKKSSGIGSGGWEFLVDCKRAEATELLRPRPTGCFIIRPHPEDHGVFSLSFKTNLKPSVDSEELVVSDARDDEKPVGEQPKTPSRPIKRDDVVQHAIIRLSDSGFRCGSFGPFATLMKLLDAVSGSLPFKLRFDQPPTQGVIKDQGSKPSPNCVFFRKLGLSEGKRLPPELDEASVTAQSDNAARNQTPSDNRNDASMPRRWQFGLFLELLVLSEVRKQLSGIAAAKYDTSGWIEESDTVSIGSTTDAPEIGPEQEFAVAARLLRPLLTWCRMMEIGILEEFAPPLDDLGLLANDPSMGPVILSEEKVDGNSPPSELIEDGDGVIRKMIKPGSGVEFRTLRLGEGGDTAMVVLFSKKEAVDWFIKNNLEELEEDAMKRLDAMEKNRVIESVDFKLLLPKVNRKKLEAKHEDTDKQAEDIAVKGIRYRLVDPWEVEPVDSREAETRGATLGRHRFNPFGLGRVSASFELVVRSLGGRHLLELWTAANGGVALTKSIATVRAPWERGSGGDLHLKNGVGAEPDPYDNSIRQHLYRNALFRRLGLPPRFMALIQVELLDLKNLTSPGGSLSLTAYALLRLKRPNSKTPLTMKARTLDSVATQPTKLGKVSGPNAPASWGSLVRFRYPLPEDTTSDGRSNDSNRESLFKGAPSVLQLSVYEKKFMSDTLLGGADVKLNGLSSGGQLEEWVPLRTETQGINWFARIRLTLRFELMCLSTDDCTSGVDEMAPSVGLRRIQQLCLLGGHQEDVRRSTSTPDLLSYFESMVT